MLTITALWLPIIISAVAVWIASAIVWTVLPHHRSDYQPFHDEDKIRQPIAEQKMPPGGYMIPYFKQHKELESPEMQQKMNQGPVALVTILPNGNQMGKQLVSSLIQNILFAIVIAYIATFTLTSNSEFFEVFRLVGVVTWLAYGAAFVQDAIWFGRGWAVIGKFVFDALIYALITAAIFAWWLT